MKPHAHAIAFHGESSFAQQNAIITKGFSGYSTIISPSGVERVGDKPVFALILDFTFLSFELFKGRSDM